MKISFSACLGYSQVGVEGARVSDVGIFTMDVTRLADARCNEYNAIDNVHHLAISQSDLVQWQCSLIHNTEIMNNMNVELSRLWGLT